MGRKQSKSDIRIEVNVRQKFMGYWTEDEEVRLCEEIAADIRRHVDNLGSVRVMWENDNRCEFCDSYWTELDDSLHNGGCCAEDANNMPDEEDSDE